MKYDLCKSKAIANYQKTWVKYNINKNDGYKLDTNFNGLDIEQISVNENFHLRKEHSEKWLSGEI